MEQAEKCIYATVGIRVRALFVDTIVMAVFGVLIAMVLNEFENFPDYYRPVPFVLIFLLYDPLFTSSFGGTLGQLSMGLRVRKAKDQTRKIILPFALLRFILKFSLGWISLLTVTGNEKKQAIHDFAVGSVVIKV